MTYKEKIHEDLNSLLLQIGDWRSKGNKVVFTNGVFDLVHVGHVSYLEEARSLGTKLIVGVNSDDSVSRLKGPNRPINKEFSRLAVLAGLQSVDAVVIFEQDTPLQLIKAVQPDILVKGGDYQLHEIVGADEVLAAGGAVRRLDFISGYSSTVMINKILRDG